MKTTTKAPMKQQKQKKNDMFLSAVIIFIAAGILLLAVGIYWWQTFMIETPPPLSVYIAPRDITAEWQTYRNDNYGFEIKYPENYSVSTAEINNPSNRGYRVLIANTSDKKEFVTLSITTAYPNLPNFNINAPAAQKSIGGIRGQEQIYEKGYCDRSACTDPFIGLWVKNNDHIYTFNFNNATTVGETYGQILSAFKFVK